MTNVLLQSFENVRYSLAENETVLEQEENVPVDFSEQIRLQARTLELIGNAMEIIGESNPFVGVDSSDYSGSIHDVLTELRTLEPEYLDRVVSEKSQELAPILSELGDIEDVTNGSVRGVMDRVL